MPGGGLQGLTDRVVALGGSLTLTSPVDGGTRLEVVLPPAVPAGTVSLTFRRPSDAVAPLADVAGRFDTSRWNRWGQRGEARQADASALLALFDAGDAAAFLGGLVRARRNILFCGATGSGKTSIAKSVLAEIPAAEVAVTERARRQPLAVGA